MYGWGIGLLAVVAHFLLPYKLYLGKCVSVYSTWRVLRQFGYEQRSVRIQGDTLFSNALVANGVVQNLTQPRETTALGWVEKE